MNTKIIQNTQLNKLWDFPVLTPGGTGRILTKHYMNLAIVMDSNELALLSWLVYQSNHDNGIKYTSNLLVRYAATIKLTRKRYKNKKKLLISPFSVRRIFMKLIGQGFLIRTFDPKHFIINPNLTYSKLYVKGKFYDAWIATYHQIIYQYGKVPALHALLQAQSDLFIEHVRSNL